MKIEVAGYRVVKIPSGTVIVQLLDETRPNRGFYITENRGPFGDYPIIDAARAKFCGKNPMMYEVADFLASWKPDPVEVLGHKVSIDPDGDLRVQLPSGRGAYPTLFAKGPAPDCDTPISLACRKKFFGKKDATVAEVVAFIKSLNDPVAVDGITIEKSGHGPVYLFKKGVVNCHSNTWDLACNRKDSPLTVFLHNSFGTRTDNHPTVAEVAEKVREWVAKQPEEITVKNYRVTKASHGPIKIEYLGDPEKPQHYTNIDAGAWKGRPFNGVYEAISKKWMGVGLKYPTVAEVADFIRDWKKEIIVGDYTIREYRDAWVDYAKGTHDTFVVDGPVERGTCPGIYYTPVRCPVINKLRAMKLHYSTPIEKVAELLKGILEGEKVVGADGRTYVVKDGKISGEYVPSDLLTYLGTEPVTVERVSKWDPLKTEHFNFIGSRNKNGRLIPFANGTLVLRDGKAEFFTDHNEARRSL